jgi:hypothetical protein
VGELGKMVVAEDHNEAGLQGRRRADFPMTKDRMGEEDEHLQTEVRDDLRDLRLARCRCCALDQRTDDCCLAAQG